MNRRKFEKHLKSYGCFLNHHGGNHDIWVNPRNFAHAPVPRHNELKQGIANGICRILKVPRPSGQ